MDLLTIRGIFARNHLTLTEYRRLPSGFGVQFYTEEGPILNIFYTKKLQLQGTNRELASGLLEELRALIRQASERDRLALPPADSSEEEND